MGHDNNSNNWVQFKTEITHNNIFRVFLFDYETNDWKLFLEKEVPENAKFKSSSELYSFDLFGTD